MSSRTAAAPSATRSKLSSTKSAASSPPPPALATTIQLPDIVQEQKQQSSDTLNMDSTLNNNGGGVKIKQKLETLSTRFDGFEDELNLSRNRKKADEDKRILILQTQLNNLQSSLALESKNRAMSVKALQNWLTDRIAQWTEQIEQPMNRRLDSLHETIQFLNQRIDGLEAKQREDREIFPKLVDGRCEELLREIQGLKSKFEANVLQRDEKEKRILLKLQNESNKIAIQFNQDKSITDEKFKQIRTSIEEEIAIRAKGVALIQETLVEETRLIHSEILQEKKEREVADEDLVQAINHYAAALQDGIKIVSTQ